MKLPTRRRNTHHSIKIKQGIDLYLKRKGFTDGQIKTALRLYQKETNCTHYDELYLTIDSNFGRFGNFITKSLKESPFAFDKWE